MYLTQEHRGLMKELKRFLYNNAMLFLFSSVSPVFKTRL